MDRRRFISGMAAATGAIAMPGTLSAAPLDQIRNLGVLRVAVYHDNRPWSWNHEGRPTGIDADIGMALAEALGVKADIALFAADENVSDDLRNAVWRGGLLGFRAADVMLHVPFDLNFAKTEDNVVFVAPYYRESFTGLCSSQTANCDSPPQLFVGKPVAAELESIPDIYLMGSFGGILRGDVRHYPTGFEAAQAVQSGEAELAVATKAQIQSAMASNPASRAQIRKSPLPQVPSKGWDIGMAVKENSRSLGFAIEDIVSGMIADGRMADIFARHGVEWEAADATKPHA